MKGLWLHFTRYFQVPVSMPTLDSCRIVEAMIPMVELYGVDLPPLSSVYDRRD